MYLRQNHLKKFLAGFQYFSEGVVCLNQMSIEPTIRRLRLRLHPKHQMTSETAPSNASLEPSSEQTGQM